MGFGAPLAAVINAGDSRHTEAQRIDQRQVLFIGQVAGDPCHIMVIHKGQHVLPFIQSPVLRTKLTQQ